jgi:branched-chain amino acid transport system ATP-binding protein
MDCLNRGITFAHAEAPIFRDLSVDENLDLGAFTINDRNQRLERIAVAKDLFPLLGERSKQLAGTMSGGEQRMLSLAMAFIAGPKLMLLDEPSLGIAPALADDIFERIRSLARQGDLSILMIEQNVRAALRITDRAYFMRNGQIVLEEAGAEALERDTWWELF